MDETKNTRIMADIQIINALIWVAIILISRYTLKGTDNYVLVFYTLVVGAGLQLSLMDYISKRFLSKRSCSSQRDKY